MIMKSSSRCDQNGKTVFNFPIVYKNTIQLGEYIFSLETAIEEKHKDNLAQIRHHLFTLTFHYN